jgi:two-component system, LytTR family, response regulator
MLTTLLIDDEERATDALRLMIDKFIPEIGKVLVCNDARQAAEMIHLYEPDLVFMDVRMPYFSGFDILEKIANKRFKVIFTTAYDEYAIAAIRFSAFDYLLKPIDVEEVIAAVKRFLASDKNYGQQDEQLQNIMYNMQANSAKGFRLALPTRKGVQYLLPHEIIRCEAVGNYTKFYTADNNQYMISRTLAEYEELLLPCNFIRTHKSHLVNKAFISFVDHDGFVVLKDSSKIDVSRRRKEEVLKAMKT